jgi:hypothetical protein
LRHHCAIEGAGPHLFDGHLHGAKAELLQRRTLEGDACGLECDAEHEHRRAAGAAFTARHGQCATDCQRVIVAGEAVDQGREREEHHELLRRKPEAHIEAATACVDEHRSELRALDEPFARDHRAEVLHERMPSRTGACKVRALFDGTQSPLAN